MPHQVRGNLCGPEWACPTPLTHGQALRRIARRAYPLRLAPSMVAGLYELWCVFRYHRVAAKRSLLPKGADADALARYCGATWEYGDLSVEEALNAQRLANTPDTMGSRLAILDSRRGIIYRDADRTRRRFLRSELFRTHVVAEPSFLERDDPRDSPRMTNAHVFGDAPLGNRPSSSYLDTDSHMSGSQQMGSLVRPWTREVPPPSGDAAPMEDVSSPSKKVQSDKASFLRGGARTRNRMEVDLNQEGSVFRNRCRLAPFLR